MQFTDEFLHGFTTTKMRPEGHILVKTKIRLPEAPRTAHVVAERHDDQNEERKEPGCHGHLDQLRLEEDVHEEEDNDDGLSAGDGKSHNWVEDAEIDIRSSDRDGCTDQQ